MTPHEALSFMYAQRRSKFDARVLGSAGLFPRGLSTGSIVKLSNEAIAMVVSVNPKWRCAPGF